MSFDNAFLLAFAAALGALFWWGFRTLPGEGWQFLASRQLFQGGLHPCIYHYRKPENS